MRTIVMATQKGGAGKSTLSIGLALAAGRGVTEHAPSSKSAEEIRTLWQWTQAKLNASVIADEAREAFPEVQFPIMLTPTPTRTSLNGPAERPLPTWADSNISWDAGL